MSSIMEVVDFSSDLMDSILAVIDGKSQKETVRRVIHAFAEAGLPIKVKRYFLPELKDTFRVLCFIKKSSEAVIMNTDGFGAEGMTLQMRLLNDTSFARLDALSEGIRHQIIHAGDCQYCSIKCGDKRYSFTYDNVAYTKCQFLCSNFRLKIANGNDVESVMALVQGELDFAATKKRGKKSPT